MENLNATDTAIQLGRFIRFRINQTRILGLGQSRP